MKMMKTVTGDCVDELELSEGNHGSVSISLTRWVSGKKLHGVTMDLGVMERRALKAAL